MTYTINRNKYHNEISIRLMKHYKSKPALVLELWKWTVRITL